MVLRYVQYTLDGALVGAHRVEHSYKKQINVAPGVHHLLVERASRGLLGARAFLDDGGVCYTFSVPDGQTVTFVGKALSEKEWVADGFENSNYQKKMVEVSICR